jgi:NADH-quinone oxidoreductase subunit M
MPFVTFAFVIASAASMGIPGFSGFAAEITILIGAWQAFPIAVWITGAGMVLVAAFTLRALKDAFFHNVKAVESTFQKKFEPITLAEQCGASLLMFATLGIGLYPRLLLDRIMPAIETMRFLK